MLTARLAPLHCLNSNQRRHSSGPVTNPYDVGLLRNCAGVWCVRVPPSKVDFRCGDGPWGAVLHGKGLWQS